MRLGLSFVFDKKLIDMQTILLSLITCCKDNDSTQLLNNNKKINHECIHILNLSRNIVFLRIFPLHLLSILDPDL